MSSSPTTTTPQTSSSNSPSLSSATSSPFPADTDPSTPPTPTTYLPAILSILLILTIFLLYLYHRHWSHLRSIRLALHGRAALVQDVAHFHSSSPTPTAALWRPSNPLTRTVSTRSVSILELGLDESAEAPPPPYRGTTAAAAAAAPTEAGMDKGAEERQERDSTRSAEERQEMPVWEAVDAGAGVVVRVDDRLPPGYRASDGAATVTAAAVVPRRPVAVITVSERLEEIDLEGQVQQRQQQSQQPWRRQDNRVPRVQGRGIGRWGSWRRLMSRNGGGGGLA